MKEFDFFLFGAVGIALMVVATVLMLVCMALDFLPLPAKFSSGVSRLLSICLPFIVLGLIFFMLALVGIFTETAIEAIKTGAYHWKSCRFGPCSTTHIYGSTQPIRFAFQTLLLLGTSGYFLFLIARILRDAYYEVLGKFK